MRESYCTNRFPARIEPKERINKQIRRTVELVVCVRARLSKDATNKIHVAADEWADGHGARNSCESINNMCTYVRNITQRQHTTIGNGSWSDQWHVTTRIWLNCRWRRRRTNCQATTRKTTTPAEQSDSQTGRPGPRPVIAIKHTHAHTNTNNNKKREYIVRFKVITDCFFNRQNVRAYMCVLCVCVWGCTWHCRMTKRTQFNYDCRPLPLAASDAQIHTLRVSWSPRDRSIRSLVRVVDYPPFLLLLLQLCAWCFFSTSVWFVFIRSLWLSRSLCLAMPADSLCAHCAMSLSSAHRSHLFRSKP